jgi:hypothetical protein
MTAEVAILNRHGVALAADSAVTVGGSAGPKIYNTVNKLFALSKFHPVGIMVYSSAEIMGVPVETVIKHFRRVHLLDQEEEALSGYVNRFKHYLETDLEVFPQSARLSACVRVARNKTRSLRNAIRRDLQDISEKKKLKQIRGNLLDQLHKCLSKTPDVSSLTPSFAAEVKDALDGFMIEGTKLLYDGVVPMTPDELDKFRELLAFFLTKEELSRDEDLPPLRGGETGIVISGFGRTEFFPVMEAIEFVFSLAGCSKYTREQSAKITTDMSAAIIPFAQKDMIQTFMNGRSPAFDQASSRMLVEGFVRREERLLADPSLSATQKKRIKAEHLELFKEIVEPYIKGVSEWTMNEHIDPTMETVSSLPKEELAVIAEALVNLTIHKRKASPDAETVGPPTDVAVISKGDGFIWIKRKHYFEPSLNPHFMQNYLRG